MTIKISNLRKPGLIYDSSKLSILGNKIAGSIQQRTKGKYIAKSTIVGNTIKINLKVLNPQTKQYVSPIRSEQSILAGRISTFLNENGVSHNIKVT